MNRRDFLRTAGGVTGGTAATAAAGTAAAAEGGGGGGGGNSKPTFPDYVSGAKKGNYVDARGQSEVTVEVGADPQALAFAPTKLWIDPGTTVTFEWVSNGHNVVPNTQPDGAGWSGVEGAPSALYDAGHTYSHTFDTPGMYTYYCQPHEGLGMKGAIAVGGAVPTESTGGGGSTPVDPEQMGVPFQSHFVGLATVTAIVVTLVFTFFLLKYGESPHTSGGNN
ncbi:MAG: plastocyanin/azurin family copper-binding protein [Haloarculaceae archaeon]